MWTSSNYLFDHTWLTAGLSNYWVGTLHTLSNAHSFFPLCLHHSEFQWNNSFLHLSKTLCTRCAQACFACRRRSALKFIGHEQRVPWHSRDDQLLAVNLSCNQIVLNVFPLSFFNCISRLSHSTITSYKHMYWRNKGSHCTKVFEPNYTLQDSWWAHHNVETDRVSTVESR